ncbi:MAG: terpene cyclase/mutase family protein, partial [Peptococcaceae bacterium]|nr:terpene cyclase/mutase family protein [Peptococcaceae bacterium]
MKQMMKNKKTIAVLLLVTMLFNIMPTAVFAEESTSPASPITAYVTIVDKGEFAIAKDGKTKIAHVEVTVTDRNSDGKLDIDETLYAAHEAYYLGGAEAGYASADSSWGLSLAKLWGDTSGAFGYMKNNEYASGLDDIVENDNHIVAYIYQDSTTWSDVYSYFNTDAITVSTGSQLDLQLTGAYYGPIEGALITINSISAELRTDVDGNVVIPYDKFNTSETKKFLVSAKSTTESMILVPPICVVTFDENYVPDDDENEDNQGNENTGNGDGITSTVTVEDIPELLENIARSYVDNSSEWVVMDMAAYEDWNPETINVTSDSAKQEYINYAISSVNASSAGETTYSKAILALTSIGTDASELYSKNSSTQINAIKKLTETTPYIYEWVTPYTLMAYNQGYGAGENEKALLTGLLALQNDNGSFGEYASVDSVGEILAAFSFYRGYVDATAGIDVEESIDASIQYLLSQISEDGTYTDGWTGYNANSTAMAVIGLSAIYDSENENITELFDKSVKGLLSFALEDNTGFGYTNNSAINSYSTEQGFRALIAASQVMKTGEAFNVYDFSRNTLTPGYEKEITSSGGSGSYVPKDDKIAVKVSIKAIDGYWMQNKSVTLEEDATVSDALLKAIKGTGITQVGAEDGYIEYMEYNGMELGEYTNGDFSGWMYKVN